MAKPKLALIPASQGSKVFSVLPSSGVGDFDFTRASTATRVNSQGLIEEVANGQSRLEYPLIDGVVSGCPSLLLEPASTNLYPYSQYYGVGGLEVVSIGTQTHTITNNYSISPDGTQNAIRFQATVGNTASDRVILRDEITSATVDSTISVYAKSNTTSNYTMIFHYEGGTRDTFIVTPEWQRFSFSEVSIAINNAGIELKGDVTSLEADVSLWGFQFENQSYPTSVIPTNGAAVTRAAETANGSGDATTFNDSEGVLFIDIKGENDGTFNYISLSDGGTTNYVGILYTDTDNQIIYRYYVGGSGVQIVVNSVDVTNFNKISVKWKANDFAIWINGFELGTATSGSLNPSGTFNELAFARGGSNNTPFYGKTKQIQYYDTALTDSELETLTSWTSFTEMAQGQQYSII